MPYDVLGEFEQSLLLAIAHLGDNAYGVTIRQEIETRAGREVAVGALYTSLGASSARDMCARPCLTPHRSAEVAPSGNSS